MSQNNRLNIKKRKVKNRLHRYCMSQNNRLNIKKRKVKNRLPRYCMSQNNRLNMFKKTLYKIRKMNIQRFLPIRKWAKKMKLKVLSKTLSNRWRRTFKTSPNLKRK
jgi:hypothetical protein